MTSSVTNNTSTSSTSSTGSTSSTSTSSSTDLSSSFLTMLTTQLQNQDPLNPADNSEITSQMAQISTVTGVNQLNSTMTAMSANITQMQMMQGTSLVGHEVLLPGNQISVDATSGTATAGYNLDAAAANVTISISDSAGNTVGTVTQTGVSAGQQGFQWTPPTGTSTTGLTFKVTATGGGKTINATPLMSDQVDAVSTTNGTLNLELKNSGTTAYSKIVAVS